ncbi:short-chain alcohol dehydrogenase [Fusarium beomiforme]|uniref:Short-chain alcohol dehydrogenase n=1 Tax=Fusarium beomiforme TaxID=44412 RepID=A0A9P5DQZ5_9HYPO|nr:short-chain alcohol dehydrogenase [Fusarium beomiforme]
MSFEAYSPGIVDCKSDVDLTNVKGKTVILLQGAKGMGEDGVRAFVAAGNAKFVKCDVTSWEDQLAMFKSAIANSPNNAIDIVVANAGINGPDEAFNIEDSDEPSELVQKILHIDLIGVIYTLKLARHYVMKHPLNAHHDRCFIWVCRALMRYVRRRTIIDGIRMNLTGPWYVGTTILSPAVQKYCKEKDIVFAKSSDAAAAWLKTASDPKINGRSFAIVPRDIVPLGYFDIGKDDYEEGDVFSDLQDILLRTSHRLQVKASDK